MWNRKILYSVLYFYQWLQALRNFAASAMPLVFTMPLDALLQRRFGRHLVFRVPEFIHGSILCSGLVPGFSLSARRC